MAAMGHERRRELGDCCGFCRSCGWGRRFMAGDAAELPERCPDCGGEVLSSCPSCGASIASLMAITCGACAEPLRADTLFGVLIRRKPERHAARPVDCAGALVDAQAAVGDNVSSP
jgi:hypothetical protein